jgi:hypothetical protein
MALLISGLTAQAAGFGATAKVGTTGLGADLTLGINDHLSLRGGISGFTYDDTVELDDAEVDGSIDMLIFPVLIDWHPAGTGFRISAGAVFNESEFSLSADDKVLTLSDIDFPVDTLTGSIETDDLTYYFGIGYGNAAGKDGRVHFSCDFGIIYYGSPTVSATAASQVPGTQAALDIALADEIAELEEEIKDYSFYPVISLGVAVRF